MYSVVFFLCARRDKTMGRKERRMDERQIARLVGLTLGVIYLAVLALSILSESSYPNPPRGFSRFGAGTSQ
jgi:hypothetical protein